MLLDQLPPDRPRLKKWLQIAAAVAGLLGVGGAGVVITSAPAGAGVVPHSLRSAEDTAPTIAGKTSYAPHQLVRLKADGVPSGAAVRWRVSPRAGVDRATTKAEFLEFAAPPGVYEVELLVIRQTPAGLDMQEQFERVVIEAPKSGPPATPPAAGKADAVGAIGRIQFGNAGCTATVIGPRRADGRWDVLTAAHCVSAVGARGTLKTKAGAQLPVRVIVREAGPDLAWLVTEASVESLAYAQLAAANPAAGVKVWHQGYGVDRPGNREDGTVAFPENSSGQTQFRLNVSPGDSGGGIVRDDTGEVVSTVCCTARLAGFGDVWGAAAARIRAARPGAVNLDQLPEPAEDITGICRTFARVWR